MPEAHAVAFLILVGQWNIDMFSSEYPKRVPFNSTSPKDQSLLTLRFPKKLWKIVNECRTGAITWSSDGTAIVIDYSKFQSEYLDNRLDIFKTSNITSFIRQLNLYGFRKVSPHYRVSVSNNPDNADIHVFRNDSFVRGRPDLLQSVTRKTGALRARMLMHKRNHKNHLGSSSSNSNGGSNTSRANCQMAYRQALSKQQREASRHSDQQTTSSSAANNKSGSNKSTFDKLPHGFNDVYWEGVQWFSPESDSDSSSSSTSTGDDCPKPKDDSKCKEEDSAIAWTENFGLAEMFPQTNTTNATSTPCAASASSSAFNNASATSDLNHLLDPSTSPKSTCQHPEAEAPSLEDSFILESVLSNMDKSLSEKIYCILMTEDNGKENSNNRLGDVASDGPPAVAASTAVCTSQQTLNQENVQDVSGLQQQQDGSRPPQLMCLSQNAAAVASHGSYTQSPCISSCVSLQQYPRWNGDLSNGEVAATSSYHHPNSVYYYA